MQEFAFVSAPSSSPATLVERLNDRAAEGWSVVAIVGGGLETTAFLSREAGATASSSTTNQAASGSGSAVAEPAGWATSPSTASTASTASPAAAAAVTTPAVSSSTQMAASSVPAQWAADPTGRYELRYWDGIRWTEHVSRAGQQYTDPL